MDAGTKGKFQQMIEEMKNAVSGIRGAQCALQWMDVACDSNEDLKYRPMIGGDLSSGVLIMAKVLDDALEDMEKLLEKYPS